MLKAPERAGEKASVLFPPSLSLSPTQFVVSVGRKFDFLAIYYNLIFTLFCNFRTSLPALTTSNLPPLPSLLPLPILSLSLSLYHPIRCSSSSAVGNASLAAATGAINVGNALSNAFYFLFTLPPTATSPPEFSSSPSLPHAYITRCPTQQGLSHPPLPFPLPAELMPHFTSDSDCVQMIAKYGNNLYAGLPPATPTCPHT